VLTAREEVGSSRPAPRMTLQSPTSGGSGGGGGGEVAGAGGAPPCE
jgi:hypothetical protein